MCVSYSIKREISEPIHLSQLNHLMKYDFLPCHYLLNPIKHFIFIVLIELSEIAVILHLRTFFFLNLIPFVDPCKMRDDDVSTSVVFSL